MVIFVSVLAIQHTITMSFKGYEAFTIVRQERAPDVYSSVTNPSRSYLKVSVERKKSRWHSTNLMCDCQCRISLKHCAALVW